MSNEIVQFERPRLPYVDVIGERFEALGVNRATWKVLCEAIYPAAKTPDSIIMALSYCQARKLDPFKRPVHIVPVWDKERGRMVETVWPGISELRTTAMRTGAYAGCDETAFGPDVTIKLSGLDVTFPEWAQHTIYRLVAGHRVPIVGPKAFWLENYAPAKRDTQAPNAMWFRRPRGQIEKCAEAGTLRRAFPEELGDVYAAEEMEGKSIGPLETVQPVRVTQRLHSGFEDETTVIPEEIDGQSLDETLDGDTIPTGESEPPRPKRKYTRRAAENSPAAAEQGDPSPQTVTDVSAETVTGNGDTDAEDEQRLEETTLSPVTSDDSLAEDDFPGDRALAAPDVEEAPDATLPEYGPDEELYRDVIHAATNLKAVANAITLFKQSEVFQAAEPSEQRAWQLLAHLKIEQLTKTDSTIAHPAHGLWRFSQWVSAGHPGGNVRETYEALKKTEAYGKTTAGQREALEHMVAVAEHE